MIAVSVTRVQDFVALGVLWRQLEQRARGSFFQSWTWVGCLAEQRFRSAILVQATEDGRTVALALFNRTRGWAGRPMLHLTESGDADLDCPYVEQNGVLAEAGREEALATLCLQAVARSHDLVLSGVGEVELAAVRKIAALVLVGRSQASPQLDLVAAGSDHLAARSANTRQQIRRSNRHYEQNGPIEVDRADSVSSAHAMLDAMAELHQASWTARGQPGSFARPFFGRFHHALVARAMPRNEVALLRVSCNQAVIGILYNFVYGGRMLAYQSGFSQQRQASKAKPGLTCHALAIREAQAQGLQVYDFLAGDSRYKRSLADGAHRQNWVRAGPIWSPRLLLEQSLKRFR